MGFESVMAVVVADNFPVQRSSCIICKFAATDIERVTCSNFGFPLAEQITIVAPLELFLVSCSSSQLS